MARRALARVARLTPLTPDQREQLVRVAMEARRQRTPWSTAVAEAAGVLREAGIPGEQAFLVACATCRSIPMRWAR